MTKVTGLEELDAAIRQLDMRTARNAITQALNQAVQPALKLARQKAPKGETGKLRKNIKKRNMNKAERNAAGVDHGTIIYIDDDGFYGRFWEFGFTRHGNHYAARPFLRPAVDESQAAVVQRFGERAGVIISRALARKAR